MNSEVQSNKPKTIKKELIIIACIALVVCAVLFLLINNGQGSEYINKVKGAHPSDYPRITYDEAFSKYYKNPKWKYTKKGNDNIVTFSGERSISGKTTTIELNFTFFNDKQFMLTTGAINGVKKGKIEIMDYESTPFKNYK